MPTSIAGRVLVTGAAGFVGGHLVPLLTKALPGAQIMASQFDLANKAEICAEIREIRPDACVHLAAVAAVATAQADSYTAWQINLHGTLNLAHALLADAPNCMLIFASSADAYGRSFASGVAMNECGALAPINTYSATKAAADLALGAMVGQGLRVVRMRAFNHTGAGQSADFAVPAFARQIAMIEAGLQDPVIRVGTLDPLRDFLDVRDVCAAYAACLMRADEMVSGTIFNLASGKPRRIGDVLDALLKLSNVSVQIENDPARLRASEIPCAYGDASAAKRLLGWTPHIIWEKTLQDVLADWRQRVATKDGMLNPQTSAV